MIEKVNPCHPDKLADRIAGAIVDLAYSKQNDPRIAVEVLLGHGECNIIAEASVHIKNEEIKSIVSRIASDDLEINYKEVQQDSLLANNQKEKMRCGDNGIFKGSPITDEQKELSSIARKLFDMFGSDGKYILDGDRLIICQSNMYDGEEPAYMSDKYDFVLNPIGYWTGGTDVDCGATNRKLGSDMGDAVTGGGLHGKDLSKADVSINIYAHILAQEAGAPIMLSCAIGDTDVNGVPYADIVEIARKYIENLGGFESLAEWGLF